MGKSQQPKPQQPIWDIFCNVIDNWGDIGVCWRLAQQLSQQHISVRLWLDDSSALAWMCAPSDQPVQIIDWKTPLAFPIESLPSPQAFIEAFGCRAPEEYLEKIAHNQQNTPVWVNLEYLSAQAHVEQLHKLPSLQHFGSAKGLTRWFFYPGFTPQTGGLLRETDLAEQQAHFNAEQWLKKQGIPNYADKLRISLFNYPNQALPQLLHQWENSIQAVHLLSTAGHSSQQLDLIYPSSHNHFELPYTIERGQLTITRLPLLPQKDFDYLLWSCDFNMVRGEDSWIRAIWANKPFVWQPYIQDDDEHLNKLNAFTTLIPDAPAAWLQFQKQWTLQSNIDWYRMFAALPQTKSALEQWHQQLEQMQDLCSSLIDFVEQKTGSCI